MYFSKKFPEIKQPLLTKDSAAEKIIPGRCLNQTREYLKRL